MGLAEQVKSHVDRTIFMGNQFGKCRSAYMYLGRRFLRGFEHRNDYKNIDRMYRNLYFDSMNDDIPYNMIRWHE